MPAAERRPLRGNTPRLRLSLDLSALWLITIAHYTKHDSESFRTFRFQSLKAQSLALPVKQSATTNQAKRTRSAHRISGQTQEWMFLPLHREMSAATQSGYYDPLDLIKKLSTFDLRHATDRLVMSCAAFFSCTRHACGLSPSRLQNISIHLQLSVDMSS